MIKELKIERNRNRNRSRNRSRNKIGEKVAKKSKENRNRDTAEKIDIESKVIDIVILIEKIKK